ncbi:UDP-N-acetylglucosamine 1-carboxyvinyltransferase [Marinilactibacillus piezotolerans]|uniref:UDP-N-acetylglucosamine 1-carboxyvinyltransferase n=1 Tax=Marinilactibacillus piezotolerans TaxID=258723 RepID=UPI0009B02792|nr:UDP-N-acetylglucosamine 1-carboxyvinyltransferase [Marinilactibacillus piezotolerans]
MEKIIVSGGNVLNGEVEVEGAKNAALPILAATILASKGKSDLSNVPLLSDIYTMKSVLSYLNVDISFDEENKEMTLDASSKLKEETPFDFMSKMRASIVVMGPLLARNGYAKVALPGGCAIGTRPIDLHLKGFEAMGVEVHIEKGYIEASAEQLRGAHIYLDFPSVGATQNIMMAATLAEGTTVIENVAREPEIVDLANFLNRMGAKVIGAGTETIRIEGVESLTGINHMIIPDRIESGTFMVAAALTKGNVLIKNAVAEHNKPLVSKLREMGVTFIEERNGLRVMGPEQLKATDVKTMPHPGFPTDMQAQMTIAQLHATGTSVMRETVFENRFMHMEELRKMNAEFKIDGQSLMIKGGVQLQGAEVASSDLRASAALILAGLVSKGYTRVTNLNHLDRGYYKFHEKLKGLGADIERTNEEVLTSTEKRALIAE